MDDTPASLAREIEGLYRVGKTEDAFALALEAAGRFPRSSLALTNLGYFYILRGEPALALQTYEAAVRANPQNAEARRGVAVAKTQCGVATQGDSTTVVPHRGGGTPVRVLVPITLGSGNVVTERLFDDRWFEVTKVAVELHPPDAPLPAHDVVFNAVGEADSSAEALKRARALLAQTQRRVLNDPARIAQTGRIAQAERLKGLPDVVLPRIELHSREHVRELSLPVLLRAPGYHAGEYFVRVERDDEIDAALAELPGDRLFAIEPIDTRDTTGAYVKYRMMLIDGKLYPLHLAISQHWKVHYFSAQMAANPAHREREAAFLREPAAALGERAWTALHAVGRALDLEYAGIDFALDAHGNVVIFESNATMAVRYPTQDSIWDYRRGAVDAVLNAVREMLLRYSSIATSEP